MKFLKICTLTGLFSSFLWAGKIHSECPSSSITLTFDSQINKDIKTSITAQNWVTTAPSELTLTSGVPQQVKAEISESGQPSYGPIKVVFSDPIPTTPVSITTSFRGDPPGSGHFTATGLEPTHIENANYTVAATRSSDYCSVNFRITHNPVRIAVKCPLDPSDPHIAAGNNFQIQSEGYSDSSTLIYVHPGFLDIPGNYVGKTIKITTTQGIGQYCDNLEHPSTSFNKPAQTVKINSFGDNPDQSIMLIEQ